MGHFGTVCIMALLCVSSAWGAEALRLPNVLSSHMVVQRERPVTIWGWDQPGQRVTARIEAEPQCEPTAARSHRQEVTATADGAGKWSLQLAEVPAGGPYVITVSGSGVRRLGDVLSGDVWLCAGQSNMEWPLNTSTDGKQEIADASSQSRIRLLRVPAEGSHEPRADVAAQWSVSRPEAVTYFSAVGYSFARALQPEIKVPVGLVQAAMGSATVETFVDLQTLGQLPPASRFPLVRYQRDFAPKPYAQKWEKYIQDLTAWHSQRGRLDAGIAPEAKNWSEPGLADAAWATMEVPRPWQQGGVAGNGAVWFRRSITLTPAWTGKDLVVCLGAIGDTDTVWWNGQQIGQTTLQTPGVFGYQRQYIVPASLLRPQNTLAVRIYNHAGNGGMVGYAVGMFLEQRPTQGDRISLAGPWKYRVEKLLPPLKDKPPAFEDMAIQKRAGMLYHGMIAPLAALKFRGVLFYQGESNAQHPNHVHIYHDLFPAMIRSWRKTFADEGLPILFVQMPNLPEPLWPEFREAQRAALALPHTGMVVAIDLGQPADGLHPLNKKPFGQRLAKLALMKVYDRNALGASPQPQRLEVSGRTVKIPCSDAAGLRLRSGDAIKGFELADEKGNWHPAQATIQNDTIVLESPDVAKPAGVRYGWISVPDYPLVENAAGLPLTPFRLFAVPPVVLTATSDPQRPDRVMVEFGLIDRFRMPQVEKSMAGYELAGDDGVFHPAESRLFWSSIQVFSPKVSVPKKLRYTAPAEADRKIMTVSSFALTPFELAVTPPRLEDKSKPTPPAIKPQP